MGSFCDTLCPFILGLTCQDSVTLVGFILGLVTDLWHSYCFVFVCVCGFEFALSIRYWLCCTCRAWCSDPGTLSSSVSVQCRCSDIHAPCFVSLCECTSWVFIYSRPHAFMFSCSEHTGVFFTSCVLLHCRLMWTRSLWVLVGSMLCVSTWLCFFISMCSIICVLSPTFLLPDYWFNCSTCSPSLPSIFPFLFIPLVLSNQCWFILYPYSCFQLPVVLV